MDTESYQEMVERLERAELIEAVRIGLAAADRVEMKPAEVFAEIRARHVVQP